MQQQMLGAQHSDRRLFRDKLGRLQRRSEDFVAPALDDTRDETELLCFRRGEIARGVH